MVIPKHNQVTENQNNITAVNQLKSSGGRIPIDRYTPTEDLLPKPQNIQQMK